MAKYYQLGEKEYTAAELVDKLGKLRDQIQSSVKLFKKTRNDLLKDRSEGKVIGKKYTGTIEVFDQSMLTVKAVKKMIRKFVEDKKQKQAFKMAHSINKDCKRLKLKKR